jgi:HK97 family phage portal protein
MTKKSRRINMANSAVSKIAIIDKTKNSRGYVEDMNHNGIIQPGIVKLNDEDAWSLFKGNEWVFATVNRIVRDCIKSEPEVVPSDKTAKVSGRLKQRIKNVKNFLENPNNNKESFAEIREKTILNMLVYGRGIIEKVNSDSGIVQELYALTPKNLRIKADKHGNIPPKDAYIIEPPLNSTARPNQDDKNLGAIKFDINEIIFMVLNNNTESFYGIKIMDIIANSVATDILRATFNSNFFLNGAEVSGILSVEGMEKNRLNKFRSDWKTQFKGVNNTHKMAVLNVPVKYIKMAMTNRDLQFSEYGVELRSKIFAAYGMQPFIMGIVDGTSGKLNSGQQVESYKDGAIRPVLNKESFYYTQEIVRMGFKYDDIKITFPTIDYADMQTQATIDREDVTACIVSINEVRARRGLPPVKWGETPLTTPGGGQIDPNTGRVIPPSEQTSSGKEPKEKPAPKKMTSQKGEVCKEFIKNALEKGNTQQVLDLIDETFKETN